MDFNNYLKNLGKFVLDSANDYARKNKKSENKPSEVIKKPTFQQISDEITEKTEQKEKTQMIDSNKEFIKLFNKLTYKHSSWEVWKDFVTVFACAISNAVDKTYFNEREKLYLQTIKKYDENERMIFPELAAQTVLALDRNTEQDFLGNIYMNLGLGNKSTSQFFTPYHICQLMAEMTLDNIAEEVREKGYISMNDPTCGAGATLIAGINTARKHLEKEHINFQNHILIVAQDIDFTVAMMCYIQISLLGVAGYVKVGNSLTDPICENDMDENYWFTPMFFSPVWNARRIFKKVDSLTRKED